MSHDTEGYWIPRTLDDPPLALFFELDTALIFMTVVLIFGMISMLVGGVMALVICKMFVRLKDNGGKGMLIQVLYWYLPSDVFSKWLISSQREYVGK